ncbi:MAG TPA: hypothetical protein DEA08_37605 [Planctomycetes bacterium]|nr:hypothetical protein [Planctomycetota bacterium]
MLHDGVADGDLAVAAHGDGALVADAEDRCHGGDYAWWGEGRRVRACPPHLGYSVPVRTSTQPTCPYCLAELLPDEERVRCEGCKTPHHKECFEENEGCAAYGCRVRLSVPSGQSIYLRPNIKIEGIPGIEQHDIGPFLLNLKPSLHQPERRRRMRCPVAYTRLGFEDNELRAGDVLKGRAVLYLPEPTKFKRLELVLTQGINSPKPVQRLELPVVEEARQGKHPRGSYPYELELVAPDYSPPTDPYQFTLVLRTGLLAMEQLRSDPRTVFLLKRKLNLPSHVGDLEGAADGNALVLPPPGRRQPPRVVVRPTDRLARRGVANLSESSEEVPAFFASVEPDPFRSSGEAEQLADPFASSTPQGSPQAEDPFAEDPFAGAEPADLEALGPNLNAYVDGELSGDELAELEALIDVDPTVELEVEHLRELRGQLRDLPRFEVPTDFTARILDEVEALEREDARRQSEARQAKLILWRNVTRFAQAAVFLLVAGGGLFLTTPQESSFAAGRGSWGGRDKYRGPEVAQAPLSKPGFRAAADALETAGAAAPASEADEEPPAAAQLAQKLGKRRVDADWELAANAEIGKVADTTKALLRRFATPENEVRSKADAAFFVKVPANQVDDLLEALEQSGELVIAPETRESLQRLHVEEDRLVLKNGFVLVGKVVEKSARHYQVTCGEVTQLIDRQEVERLERAATLRRVRLLVR